MQQKDYIIYLITNIILHLCILFTILGAFFIFYISKIEENAFQKEISSLNDTLKSQLDNNISPEEKTNLKSALQTLSFDDLLSIYSTPAKTTTINNKWLKGIIWCIVIFLILILLTLLSIYYLRCGGYKINFYEILTENIIIFIIVGAIEISFFLFIAARYVPVKPSTMTDVFIDTLQEELH